MNRVASLQQPRGTILVLRATEHDTRRSLSCYNLTQRGAGPSLEDMKRCPEERDRKKRVYERRWTDERETLSANAAASQN
jgi:hypothetical protein